MQETDISLMAHLMRRAGFGEYNQLEQRVAVGYEATVEELLHPEEQPDLPMDLMLRYHVDWKESVGLDGNQNYWTYRMVNSLGPLEEKIALFWHGILCVGNSKLDNAKPIKSQLDMFRDIGLGRFPDLLLEFASHPAIIYYLDNQLSHKTAINENWGRELLELFTMGVGMDGHPNYTEDDVQECARAFTGWTVGNAVPRYPYGHHHPMFLYNPADHDDEEKTFLGETGRWNGQDVIDIVAKQPATARFISRHLYNFFVADEPAVPAWQDEPPRDPAAIKMLEEEYFRSNYNIRDMLRVLFNSDFFKDARFARVKSPAEVVAGTMRLVGGFTDHSPNQHEIAREIRYMGQDLLNPPTVEGWHTGRDWMDSGTLLERINFAAEQVGDINQPGIRAIINRLASEGATISPERLVDGCLELLGDYQLAEETRSLLVDQAGKGGALRTEVEEFAQQVGQTLQLIVSTQEYQFA